MTSHQTTCTLSFHGAAANSCPHSLCWVRCPRLATATDFRDATSSSEECTILDEDHQERHAHSRDLSEVLLYPSSGVVNLCTTTTTTTHSNSTPLTCVTRTLVTSTQANKSGNEGEKKVLARGEAAEDAAALRSITAIAWVDCGGGDIKDDANSFGIVAAFSDGTVTSWRWTYDLNGDFHGWKEYVLIGTDPSSSSTIIHQHESILTLQESIADVSSVALNPSSWLVGTASSSGILLSLSHVSPNDDKKMIHTVWTRQIGTHSTSSMHITHSNHQCLIFAGSASPRHNKVWVYTLSYSSSDADQLHATITGQDSKPSWVVLPTLIVEEPHYHGCLLGHQDWITCFAWLDDIHPSKCDNGRGKEALLASSGHDAKIRLWKFTSITNEVTNASLHGQEATNDNDCETIDVDSGNEDEDEANIDDLEKEEGEARLIIHHSSSNAYSHTAVSLEALLIGHEEAVTSLSWRNTTTNPSAKPCLLSSSMDRTILLWMEEDYEQDQITSGVWVPISRVGSAGGILGGSIGASLMGFVDATFSPGADRIVGHGYGGSLHFWSIVANEENPAEDEDEDEEKYRKEDVLLGARWLADPCITGHFRPVQDLAWDPDGEYLLTVGSDQTTRLWAEVPTSGSSCRWMEVGRPQVHGYDMTSIVCVGGQGNDDGEPRHRFVSGADEKVLRVFDAPVSTLRLLSSLKRLREPAVREASDESKDVSWRVERAFLPSLGLSNKATADTEHESSKYAGPTNDDEFVNSLNTIEGKHSHEFKLPSERDLGVTTLWPETRKLFGHDSELVSLDAYRAPVGSNHPTLVASSCKARNDVASAAIRLWNVKLGKCVGVLKGGHRSTASTLSFSKDGKYLASSGKDRRICIWRRQGIDSSDGNDNLSLYELSAATESAHKRIVWSVHFCPAYSNILASGSRDGFVKVWRVSESDDGCETNMEEIMCFEPASKAKKKSEPVTAVAFAERVLTSKETGDSTSFAILGIGTESGHIEVWSIPIFSGHTTPGSEKQFVPTLLQSITGDNSHFYTVNKIAWRPLVNDDLNGTDAIELSLASCGQDCGVRIFHFTII